MPSVQPLAEADLPAATELVHLSKFSMTINRLLWNDWPNHVEAQRTQTAEAVRAGFLDSACRSLKAVDDESGEVLGYIILTAKRTTTTPIGDNKEESGKDMEKPPESSKPSPALNPAVLSVLSTAMADIEKEIAGADHIAMPAMAVKQSHHNKGVGRMLMNAAFEYARTEKLPLFVISDPGAQGFFGKLGLREVKHVDIDLSQYAPPYTGFGIFRMTGMLWSPNAQAGH